MVSLQFSEWHEILNEYQKEIHSDIDLKYSQFDKYFDLQAQEIHELVDLGENWQVKVCDILDQQTEKVNQNPEYISYDLLDTDPNNPNSVESIYSTAELWIQESLVKREYKVLQNLQNEYEKVLVWFEPDFKKRLEKISKVIIAGEDELPSPMTPVQKS